MKTYDEIAQNYKVLNSNTDVKYETILSSFDKKITLLNWLNKIDNKLVDIENDVTTLSNSFGTLNDQVSENTTNITELTSNFNNLNGQVSNITTHVNELETITNKLETTNSETFDITLSLSGAWGASSVSTLDAATPLSMQFTFRTKKTIAEIENLFAPFANITDTSIEADEFTKRLITFLNEFITPAGSQIPVRGFVNMLSGSTKAKRVGPVLSMTNLTTATDLVILIYYQFINETSYHSNQTSITLSMNNSTMVVKNGFKTFETLYFSIYIENLDKSKILFNHARL